ncbi:hypothetical protein [Nonomuraea sp. NPDC050691]|uniref:hypothetical protein n=1 Tax=Nonomuraea sp. NPDC050691 TaxID=3155661 RepID=UPI003402287A
MDRITPAAVAAAAALLPLIAAVPPAVAAAASPTPSGSVKAYEISQVGPYEVQVGESIRCLSNDTVTLQISVHQTVSAPDQPAPSGHTTVQTACTPSIERRAFRVPITNDGPLTPQAAVVLTAMYNSAGTKIHDDSIILPLG